MVGRLVIN